MNDRNTRDVELARDYFRVKRRPDSTLILVRTISWDGPAHPRSTWKPGAMLPASAGTVEVNATIERLLASERFFRICEECGQRTPAGHMHDERICQGCAEWNHGVVH